MVWASGGTVMNELVHRGSWLLALIGAGYGIWILVDCWRHARTQGRADKRRRSISQSDLLSQVLAAVVLLVVVAPMLLLHDRPKRTGDPGEPDDKPSFVKIDGMRDLARHRLHFTSGWTGGALEGADLIGLPVTDGEVRARLEYGPDLQWLNLTNTNITNDILADLAAMPGLASLNLGQTAITDNGLAALTGAQRLDVLSLKETEISDAGLIHLVKLSTLSVLDVRQTAITDRGLKSLRGAPRLREVFVTRGRRSICLSRDKL